MPQSLARKVITDSNPETIKQHKKEVESLRLLQAEPEPHPNIIQYIQDGMRTPSSICFIDMEFCEMNLEQFIHGTRTVTGTYGLPQWDKENPDVFLIIAIFQQLLSGLDFIHRKNLIHRDVDPKNSIAPHGTRYMANWYSIIFCDLWVVENWGSRFVFTRKHVRQCYGDDRR